MSMHLERVAGLEGEVCVIVGQTGHLLLLDQCDLEAEREAKGRGQWRDCGTDENATDERASRCMERTHTHNQKNRHWRAGHTSNWRIIPLVTLPTGESSLWSHI